jgi:hypothetical protein
MYAERLVLTQGGRSAFDLERLLSDTEVHFQLGSLMFYRLTV